MSAFADAIPTSWPGTVSNAPRSKRDKRFIAPRMETARGQAPMAPPNIHALAMRSVYGDNPPTQHVAPSSAPPAARPVAPAHPANVAVPSAPSPSVQSYPGSHPAKPAPAPATPYPSADHVVPGSEHWSPERFSGTQRATPKQTQARLAGTQRDIAKIDQALVHATPSETHRLMNLKDKKVRDLENIQNNVPVMVPKPVPTIQPAYDNNLSHDLAVAEQSGNHDDAAYIAGLEKYRAGEAPSIEAGTQMYRQEQAQRAAAAVQSAQQEAKNRQNLNLHGYYRNDNGELVKAETPSTAAKNSAEAQAAKTLADFHQTEADYTRAKQYLVEHPLDQKAKDDYLAARTNYINHQTARIVQEMEIASGKVVTPEQQAKIHLMNEEADHLNALSKRARYKATPIPGTMPPTIGMFDTQKQRFLTPDEVKKMQSVKAPPTPAPPANQNSTATPVPTIHMAGVATPDQIAAANRSAYISPVSPKPEKKKPTVSAATVASPSGNAPVATGSEAVDSAIENDARKGATSPKSKPRKPTNQEILGATAYLVDHGMNASYRNSKRYATFAVNDPAGFYPDQRAQAKKDDAWKKAHPYTPTKAQIKALHQARANADLKRISDKQAAKILVEYHNNHGGMIGTPKSVGGQEAPSSIIGTVESLPRAAAKIPQRILTKLVSYVAPPEVLNKVTSALGGTPAPPNDGGVLGDVSARNAFVNAVNSFTERQLNKVLSPRTGSLGRHIEDMAASTAQSLATPAGVATIALAPELKGLETVGAPLEKVLGPRLASLMGLGIKSAGQIGTFSAIDTAISGGSPKQVLESTYTPFTSVYAVMSDLLSGHAGDISANDLINASFIALGMIAGHLKGAAREKFAATYGKRLESVKTPEQAREVLTSANDAVRKAPKSVTIGKVPASLNGYADMTIAGVAKDARARRASRGPSGFAPTGKLADGTPVFDSEARAKEYADYARRSRTVPAAAHATRVVPVKIAGRDTGQFMVVESQKTPEPAPASPAHEQQAAQAGYPQAFREGRTPPSERPTPTPMPKVAERPRAAEAVPTAPPAAPEPVQVNRPVKASPSGNGHTLAPTPASDFAGPPIRGIKGKRTEVDTADDNALPGQYAVVEADSLIPSHDARKNFASNPTGDLNERPYHNPKEAKASRETVKAIAANPKPNRILTDTPDATNGPPIIAATGQVIGGNARAMGVQLAYARGGDAAKTIREATVRAARKFGIDPAKLTGVKEPVIVRVLDNPGRRGELSRILNEGMATAKSNATEAVSRGHKVSSTTAQLVSNMMRPDEHGNVRSMRDVLASPKLSNTLVGRLVRDGAWTSGDVSRYTDPKTGVLTPAGKLAVEDTLLGRLINDPSVMGNLSSGVRGKLMSALSPLTRAENTAARTLIKTKLKEAAEALPGYKASGATLRDYFFNQQNLPGTEPPGYGDPAVAALVDAMDRLGPRQFRHAATRFADMAGAKDTGTGRFDFAADAKAPTAERAIVDAFSSTLRSLEPATATPEQLLELRREPLPSETRTPPITEINEAARQLKATPRWKALPAQVRGLFAHSKRGDEIHLSDVNDTDAAMHELSHAIDAALFGKAMRRDLAARIGGDDAQLRRELVNVSTLKRPMSRNASSATQKYRANPAELVADYIHTYLENPSRAARLAPAFTRGFDKALAEHPDVQKIVDGLMHGNVEPGVPSAGKGPIENIPQPRDTAGHLLPAWVRRFGRRMDPDSRQVFESAATVVKKAVRLKAAKFALAHLRIDKAFGRMPEGKRIEIGAAIEGTGILTKKGDTGDAVLVRLSDRQKQVLKHVRHLQEQFRQEVNRFAQKMGHDEYIKYVENYLSHFYEKGRDGETIRKFVSEWSKESQHTKQRTFPTLKDAVDAGLTPISQDPKFLMQQWARNNWSVMATKGALEELKKLKTPDGTPALMSSDAPSDYVFVEDHLLDGVGHYVHPAVYKALRQLVRRPGSDWARWIVGPIKTINTFARVAKFAASLFHPIILETNTIANMGRWYNPLRGVLLVGEKDPITGRTKAMQITAHLGYKMSRDEGMLERAVSSGMQVGEAPTGYGVHSFEKGLRWVERHTGKGVGSPENDATFNEALRLAGAPVHYGAKVLRKLYEAENWALWNYLQNSNKMMLFYDLTRRLEASGKWEQLGQARVDEAVGRVVNHLQGGQEWETNFKIAPGLRNFLHGGLLSLDWTYSKLALGTTAVRGVVGSAGLEGVLARNATAKLALTALVAIPNAVQAAIHELYGQNDPDHKRWAFENGPANWFNIDITPLYRTKGSPWYDPHDKARHYTGVGKEVTEMLGWLHNPLVEAKRKLSPAVQIAWEQAVGEDPNGYEMPWKRQDLSLWESLPQRGKAVLAQFKPISMSGSNFGFSLPAHKGTTFFGTTQSMIQSLRFYAEPTAYQKVVRSWESATALSPQDITRYFNGPQFAGRLQDIVKAQLQQAKANGVDGAGAYKKALRTVRGMFLSQMLNAVESGDTSAQETAAAALIRLHEPVGTIERMRQRWGEPLTAEQTQQLESAYSQAHRRLPAGGGIAGGPHFVISKDGRMRLVWR